MCRIISGTQQVNRYERKGVSHTHVVRICINTRYLLVPYVVQHEYEYEYRTRTHNTVRTTLKHTTIAPYARYYYYVVTRSTVIVVVR